MTEKAYFGGGCFWCTEAVFKDIRGVIETMPGYAGGATAKPSYEQVLTGKTGHAEITEIEYDPSLVGYPDLLAVFFATHDSSTKNRQGADVGTQYRSIILYSTERQKINASAFIEDLKRQRIYKNPIVTEIKKLDEFYPAEEYHHNYYKKNTTAAYCHAVINPKLVKLRQEFADLIK